MLNFDKLRSSDLHDQPDAAKLFGCRMARYAELLSPDDIAEIVAEEGADLPAEGWVVLAELEQVDLERLTAERFRKLNLAVRDFGDGLPVVVLTLLAGGVRYVWAVPMWEVDAQVWLRDAVDRGRIALALNAIDAPLSIVLTTGKDVLPCSEKLLEVTQVSRHLEHPAHLLCMVNAGMLILNEEPVQQHGGRMPCHETRLMVAGRGDNAAHLMNLFTAGAELALSLQPSASQAIQ